MPQPPLQPLPRHLSPSPTVKFNSKLNSNSQSYPSSPFFHPFLPTLPTFLLSTLSRLLSLSTTPLHPPLRHVTIMPFPRKPIKPKTISDFPTLDSLTTYLQTHIPLHSLTSWGTSPGTKTIHNLYLELSQGETTLLDTTPPTRSLHVICLNILSPNYPSKTLLESHQLLSDGRVRYRNRALSEKLKTGEEEDLVLAAKRAVREELGEGKTVRVMSDTYVRRVEERDSIAYPGLPGCYTLHVFDAFVDGLDDGVDEFVTEECGEGDGDGDGTEAITVKKHFWKWVPVGGGGDDEVVA